MKPLEDVRVISLEQYGAGPFGSLYLADLGAEVIKIEDARTAGDIGRYVPPFNDAEDSLFFQTFNRNKKSVVLDLTAPAARQVLLDLVKVSDVVYSNLRGDVPEKLGIRYEDLKATNSRIVCCSLSGFGMTGPRRAQPAYDYLLQGLAGWMTLTGEPDGPPTKSGLSLVDYGGGLVAALTIVAAVHASRRDGVGSDCDLSLFDVAISLLTYLATWNLNAGYEPRRTSHSAHPSLVPFQNFQTRDGWIVVGCAKEKFWTRLASAIGRSDLLTVDRFRDFAKRGENAEELLAMLTTTFLTEATDHWVRLLSDAGVPVAPVVDVAHALQDPQTIARQLILEVPHPTFGRIRQVRTAARVGDGTHAGCAPAPTLGQHNNEILASLLNYDGNRIQSLARAGAFGSTVPVPE